MKERGTEGRKVCSCCHKPKRYIEFSVRSDGYGRAARCLACRREDYREHAEERREHKRQAYANETPAQRLARHKRTIKWKRTHREQINAHGREVQQKRRLDVLKRYGNKCQCCGETRTEFLSIDHVHGGGTKERKLIGQKGVYNKLWKSPTRLSGYQVLCYNCNLSLGFLGYCPHTREKIPIKIRRK
jgi:hypothetical protein